jgi:hypothetical protein
MAKSKPAADEVIFGLLSMVCTEKNILGMDLRGDVVQRDVAQVAVNFSDHRYIGAAGDETESRRELMRRGFDFLIEKALANLVAARTKKAELDQQRQLLRRKLKTMASGSFGLEALFANGDADRPSLEALEADIQDVEAHLMNLGADPHALEHSLEQIRAVLGNPAHWLDLRSVSLALNQMSIKTGPGTGGTSHELTLTELFSSSGGRRIILLGRFPPQDLPPRPDFLEQAGRILG